MTESDGIEESISHNIREALQSAERSGRVFSKGIQRVRERMDNQRESDRRRAEARLRYRGAWEQAQEKLKGVHDSEWWDKATPAQIADMYQVATTWRKHEKEAKRADKAIYEQVLERYGHDLRTPSRDQVQEDLEKVGNRHTEIGEEEQASARENEPPFDSDERREQMEAEMLADGIDSETIAARMAADTMNGCPPRDAVESKHAETRLRGRAMRNRTQEAETVMDR